MRFAVLTFVIFTAELLKAEEASMSFAPEAECHLREGLVWIDVRAPRSERPLHFLLDTGSNVSVLNLSTTKRLDLALGPRVSVMGVGGTVQGYWPVRFSPNAGQIGLPGEYLALDLSALSRACSNSVDGLIGADFFRDRVVQIDYAQEKFRVLNTKPSAEPLHSIPLEVRRCGLRIPISVNGHKSQLVRLDTGCALGLHWVTKEVPAGQCTSRAAVGLSEVWTPETVTSVALGKLHIDGVATGLHQEPIFPGECGLLGNGLLAQFGIITVDCKWGRLILGPPPPE